MPEIITADNLSQLSGIRHGFYTSEWGGCGYYKDPRRNERIENRDRVAESLGVAPQNLLSCEQIHSPDVVTVTKAWSSGAGAAPSRHINARPKADAMVTKEKGLALGILTADCVPLLLADPGAGVIGAAHAGWRGAISGVIENTLEAMEKLGANRSAIRAALGPCIAQKSYEVGPEFPAPFLAENPDNAKFFRPAFKSNRTMFDLPGYVAAKLRGLGVASVELPAADTCAEPERFFSHRRSTLQGVEREGSLISVIVLSG